NSGGSRGIQQGRLFVSLVPDEEMTVWGYEYGIPGLVELGFGFSALVYISVRGGEVYTLDELGANYDFFSYLEHWRPKALWREVDGAAVVSRADSQSYKWSSVGLLEAMSALRGLSFCLVFFVVSAGLSWLVKVLVEARKRFFPCFLCFSWSGLVLRVALLATGWLVCFGAAGVFVGYRCWVV
ncbi:hypothetical protein U1Q18_043148, partial [Sarracenia purpurea var. burkii]